MTARDPQPRTPHGAANPRSAADTDTGAAPTTPSTVPSVSAVPSSGEAGGRPIARSPWRPPTRRSFVAMIGAAAASLAIRKHGPDMAIDAAIAGTADGAEPPVAADPARSRPAHGTTRWIGHC
jgi:hypothetical protein